MGYLGQLVQWFHSQNFQIVLVPSILRVSSIQVVSLSNVKQAALLINRIIQLSVHTIHFHDLEEGADLLLVRLFVDINYVVEGQNTGTDPLHFVKKLRQLNLNRHKKDRHTVREIELRRA